MAQDASKLAPVPSRPRCWCLQAWILMAFWQNADPFLDGFGIILAMQIPSRLHVIEASKAFSKIEFQKGASSLFNHSGKKYGRIWLLLSIKNSIKYSMSQGGCWTTQDAPVRSSRALKEKSRKYIWGAFRPCVQVRSKLDRARSNFVKLRTPCEVRRS